jgi:hypothetical protein
LDRHEPHDRAVPLSVSDLSSADVKESRFSATAGVSSIASSNPSFEQYPFKYFSALLKIVLAVDVFGYILQNFVDHIKLS